MLLLFGSGIFRGAALSQGVSYARVMYLVRKYGLGKPNPEGDRTNWKVSCAAFNVMNTTNSSSCDGLERSGSGG
jgi:hypothetical protein